MRNIKHALWEFIPIFLVFISLALNTTKALPSFARQLDMQCTTCHTEFPILNDMGRQFKLSGYTMSSESTNLPPIAFMIMPSFT